LNATPRETDEELLARLRSGDERAFAALVDGLHGRLVSLAASFTSSPALAEDIVQETWLGVIRGLGAFEGRSSLRTWIFSILVRRARTMAGREARRNASPPEREPLVEWEPGRGSRGLWEETPVPWALEDPAAIFQSGEALEVVRAALSTLPDAQRQVVLLRDVEDVPAADVCNILEVSETNQRVLLHRGRARIRRALDRYVRDGTKPTSRAAGGARTTFGLRGDAPPEGAADTEREGPAEGTMNVSGGI
jgi:RNA polymerase sigma-70 factor (ECF subfamily)